jgi:hypothetical protein
VGKSANVLMHIGQLCTVQSTYTHTHRDTRTHTQRMARTHMLLLPIPLSEMGEGVLQGKCGHRLCCGLCIQKGGLSAPEEAMDLGLTLFNSNLGSNHQTSPTNSLFVVRSAGRRVRS